MISFQTFNIHIMSSDTPTRLDTDSRKPLVEDLRSASIDLNNLDSTESTPKKSESTNSSEEKRKLQNLIKEYQLNEKFLETGGLTAEKLQHLRVIFDFIDSDQGGSISNEEFQELMVRVGKIKM